MNSILIKALKNSFEMSHTDATELVKTLKKTFRGKEEVEDMKLDKYTRGVFYELHRQKILKVRREEFKENSKIVRKYYWSFDHEAIKNAADQQPIQESPYLIYEKIPRHAWLLRNSNT
ncbi:MAG: hypothetical protein QXL17_01210 [Candidatus Thermoplasmatota archaeon]